MHFDFTFEQTSTFGKSFTSIGGIRCLTNVRSVMENKSSLQRITNELIFLDNNNILVPAIGCVVKKSKREMKKKNRNEENLNAHTG